MPEYLRIILLARIAAANGTTKVSCRIGRRSLRHTPQNRPGGFWPGISFSSFVMYFER
jgi:hypothetical protein